MKKLLLLTLAFNIVSCSTENDKEREVMCCGSSIEDITALIKINYENALAKDLSERQKVILEDEYQKALNDPCTWEKESLESSGATCNGSR